MRLQLLVLIIILISIAFVYGVTVGLYEIFPYDILNNFKDTFYNDLPKDNFSISNIEISELESLVLLKNHSDIEQKRILLLDFIWKENIPHDDLPNQVEKNITDNTFENLNNLKQIDKIYVEMEYGVDSTVYHFIPESTNNKLIIFHTGHAGGFRDDVGIIQKFLDNQYSVLAFSMPLHGMNNQPIINDPNFGKIHLVNHNSFNLIEDENFTPMKFFVQPIFITLNYVDQNYSYESINMIGLSGGGWTTTIYAALDDRISKSFPVAGSLPIFLRMESKDIGDYEQTHEKFYRIANYLELYILGSYGENRKQFQFFNKFDPCCFSGTLSNTYSDFIKNRLSELGSGEFDTYIDESNKTHTISKKILDKIINEINN